MQKEKRLVLPERKIVYEEKMSPSLQSSLFITL